MMVVLNMTTHCMSDTSELCSTLSGGRECDSQRDLRTGSMRVKAYGLRVRSMSGCFTLPSATERQATRLDVESADFLI